MNYCLEALAIAYSHKILAIVQLYFYKPHYSLIQGM
jgi:hypothetical protein